MQLRQLEYVDAIVRHRTMRQAARELMVTQATISQQVHQLEREWGVALFERQGRALHLTSEGAVLIEPLQGLLRDKDELVQRVSELRDPEAGTLRLGAIPSVAVTVLPSLYTRFHRDWPQVRLECHERGTHELIRAIQLRELDVAIVAASPLVPLSLGGLVLEHLTTHRLVVVVARGHPLARQSAATLDRLRQQRVVLFHKGYLLRDLVLSLLGPDIEHRIGFSTDNSESARTMVRSRIGIMFLPDFVVAQWSAGELHGLRMLDLQSPILVDLCAAYAPQRFRPRFFGALLSILRASVRSACQAP